MLCAFGKNTEETVLDNFSLNRLIGPQRTDGSYFVLKQEEFDQANRDLSDEVLSQFNISNAFFVREGTTARFNKTFAQLVDIVSARSNNNSVIQLTPSTRQVLDEVTDEVLETIPTKNFTILFIDGATSSGTIVGDTARISGIQAPKSGSKVVRGTKTYERVLAQLKQQGVNTVQIVLQSVDSRAAISKLVESGKLTNPRNMRGISVDKFPTTFDIPSQSPISSPGLPDLNIPEGWVSPC